MRDRLQQLQRRDFDAKFLFEFAPKASFKTLSGFALTAREFPEATQVILRSTLGDQESALIKYQSSCNFHDGQLRCRLLV
jgi:hypothetical protein